MRQRLYCAWVALSVLLFVTTAILWLRCIGLDSDRLSFTWTSRFCALLSVNGRIYAGVAWGPLSEPSAYPRLGYQRAINLDDTSDAGIFPFLMGRDGHQFAATGVASSSDFQFVNPDLKVIEIMVPHWAVLFLAAVLPVLLSVQLIGTNRFRSGHCRNCRYDLRASPIRCPECGRPIAVS